MNVSRRNFLKGAAAGTAGTALTAGVLAGGARADGSTAHGPSAAASYPFHGTHQAGVLTPGPAGKQAFACFAAFDTTAGSRAEPGRPDAHAHQPGPVPDLRRHPARSRRGAAAVGQRRPRPGRARRRPDRHRVRGIQPVRRPLRPRRPHAEEADADAGVPQRLARPRVAARRSPAPAVRQPPGHDPPRDPRHHQAHPRRRCSCAGRWTGTTPRRARRGRRGTCSGSRTAPPTRPAVSRAA